MKAYYDWHTEKIGFKPKVDGSDGKGLKEIIKYLSTVTDQICETFEYILRHWDDLDDFYRRQTRLRQINSNLHNIIYHFKNGKSTKKTTGVSEEYLRRLAENLSK